MKKNIPLFLFYFLAFAVTAVNMFFSIKGSIFSDIRDLPKGEFLSAVENPEGGSKINIYKIENKLGVAIRGELETSKKKTNVFWQTGIDEAETFWENGRVVNINGVSMDVLDGGFYDCRRGISLFQEGAIEGDEENINE